jgi:hypothetical protein
MDSNGSILILGMAFIGKISMEYGIVAGLKHTEPFMLLLEISPCLI